MAQEWSGVAGRRVLLTGATGGIGLAAAEALAARGARLAIVARSAERAGEALTRIRRAAAEVEVDVFLADLSSQAAVRALAAEVLERCATLEVLVNNAGAVYRSRQLSVDGIELTWAVNHLAPFLLTNLLLERLRASAPARIVTTSSLAHRGAQLPFGDVDAERSYRGWRRYGETKLANIAFTAELARRLEGSGVTANCFHPGLVASGFNRNNGRVMRAAMGALRPLSRSPEHGARTLVWLADAPEASGEQGGYFVDERRKAPSAAARDMVTAGMLWALSERQTGLWEGSTP